MSLLIPPRFITFVTLNCNCLLTCIATLEFELKGKNHLIYLYTINPYNKH